MGLRFRFCCRRRRLNAEIASFAGRLENCPRRATVLFVDDEEIIRRLAESALQRVGWLCGWPANGAEAVQLFEEHRKDVAVVVLDFAMPVMGGEEALDRIKAIRAGVPVIISTGYGETEAARHFAGKETAGFLQKPYTASQLVEAIAVAVGRPRSKPAGKRAKPPAPARGPASD